MRVLFVVVPPGGGEVNFSFDVNMEAAPRMGEYVFLNVEGEGGGFFRVLYVTHDIDTDALPNGAYANPRNTGLTVQIEPVNHPMTTGPVKEIYDFYATNPRYADKIHEFPESGY